jgi:hypothetical protein
MFFQQESIINVEELCKFSVCSLALQQSMPYILFVLIRPFICQHG